MGQVYKYSTASPQAELTTIVDSVGNEVALTHHTSGCEDGQLKRVTDASGEKYLEFGYGGGIGVVKVGDVVAARHFNVSQFVACVVLVRSSIDTPDRYSKWKPG